MKLHGQLQALAALSYLMNLQYKLKRRLGGHLRTDKFYIPVRKQSIIPQLCRPSPSHCTHYTILAPEKSKDTSKLSLLNSSTLS